MRNKLNQKMQNIHILNLPDMLDNISPETLELLKRSVLRLNSSLSIEIKANLAGLHSDLLQRVSRTSPAVASTWIMKWIEYNNMILDSVSATPAQEEALKYSYSLIRAKFSYSIQHLIVMGWNGILSQTNATTVWDSANSVYNVTIEIGDTNLTSNEVLAKFNKVKNSTQQSSDDYAQLQNAKNNLKHIEASKALYNKTQYDWNHMKGKNTLRQLVQFQSTNLVIRGG